MASVCLIVVLFAFSSLVTNVLSANDSDSSACHHGDMVYPLGTQWTQPGYCRWFICEENNQIVEKGCTEYVLLEGCYMSEYDMSQDYPDCCPQLHCPDEQVIALQDWYDH